MDLTLRVGLVALLGSSAWHQAGPAASSSVSITKDRTQECKAAMERIIKEAQKGAEANFDSGDKRLMEYCRQATLARDALTVSRAPARAKGIERQVLLAVREAAARIVTKLNELGPKADYADEDIRLLDKFAVAISAVDCLASAAQMSER